MRPHLGASLRVAAAAFLLTGLGIVVIAAAAAAAVLNLNSGRVVRGVVVAQVDVGGLDRASAEARLREQLPGLSSGHLTIHWGTFAGQIEYADIGRDYDMTLMLDAAMAVGHSGDAVADLRDQLHVLMSGATVTPRTTWDQAALAERLAGLAASAQRSPIDAAITYSGTGYVVQPAMNGVSIDVGAAYSQAAAAVATLSPADTEIATDPTPVPPQVATSQAQQYVDQLERVVGSDLAVNGDGLSVVIGASTIRGWVSLEPSGPGSWETVVDQDAISRVVADIGKSVHIDPVDATFHWSGGAIVVIPEKVGRDLDVPATTASVYSAIAERADGRGASAVAVTMHDLQPAFTAAQAPQMVMISAWTTGFIPSERNFLGKNITIPARIIDGTVVMPGAKFDFWRTVGDLSNIGGIGPGGVIQNGHTDPTGAIGGGICTVSTTLWNAALRAGLDLDERHAHSFYINRYPTGLDATVFRSASGGGQNMTWINDTPYPVTIRTVVGRSKRACSSIKAEFGSNVFSNCLTFELWSLPLDRHVSLSRPAITAVAVLPDYIKYSDTSFNGDPLLPTETYRLDYPVVGFSSSVTRTVKDPSGKVLHSEVWTSKYVPVDGILLVGWQEGDPPIGTILPNPEPALPFGPPGWQKLVS